MKELQSQEKLDLPKNFLQRIWIEPGTMFNKFLSHCQDHDLLFSVDVPCEDSDNQAMLTAVNKRLESLASQGGPRLPDQEPGPSQQEGHRWEFLSCKKTKVKGRNFRGKAKPGQGSTNMIMVVEIGTSEIMLAPVNYKVRLVTKQFGFKNTIRCESNEPDKFVVIGQ